MISGVTDTNYGRCSQWRVLLNQLPTAYGGWDSEADTHLVENG